MGIDDWQAWHRHYDDPDGSLARRLAAVRRLLADELGRRAGRPTCLTSLCAGDGRDTLPVLASYAGAPDAEVLLVCGVLGHLTDDDLARLADSLSQLVARDGRVIWTRADRTEGTEHCVGVHRHPGPAALRGPAGRLFRFAG